MADWDIQDLFRRHNRELGSFVRRYVSSPEVAADLSQDAFVRMLCVRAPAPIQNAEAYLYRIAVNLALNHLRRERIVSFSADGGEAIAGIADDAPSAERVLHGRQLVRIVQETLESFTPVQREVLVLSRVEGRTLDEIGRRLGMSPKTAFGQLVRMLTRLQHRLDEAGR
ncbi:sigma-70 family RNA polymerase sigma factor [Methylopila sp. M107]|uniref:RNA polymerase sigma factor n=1 Tax=Methylopila sp. M107 TaxID=1101190 RepID=UPI000369C0C2|nr:sigma-70 family RNA polymerase sigma factor [Methylopila sp. M107]